MNVKTLVNNIYDESLGQIACLCGHHKPYTFYPMGTREKSDTKVTMCTRCAKMLKSVKIYH